MTSPVIVRVFHSRRRRGQATLSVSLEAPAIGDELPYDFTCNTKDAVFGQLA